MSKSFLLSDFGASKDDLSPVESPLPPTAGSDEAYEDGYKAGWDDAVRKSTDDAQTLTADLSENLQSISFEYHAARTAILDGLQRGIEEMLGQVLPAMARDGLGQKVSEIILKLLSETTETDFLLQINPTDRDTIADALPQIGGVTLQLKDVSELAPGQVLFTLASIEEQLDINRSVQEILQLSRDFFASETLKQAKGAQNG